MQANVGAVPSGMQRSALQIVAWCRCTSSAAAAGLVLFAALGLWGWWISAGWIFVGAVALPAMLAAHIDVASRRLPDQLVLLALVPTMVATVAESSAVGLLEPVGAVLLGMMAMGCAPFVIHVLAPDSVGFGDVKLSIVLGASLGTWAPVLGVAALAAASLIALTESLVRRRAAIAFGPALVAGFVITAVFAAPLIARLGGMSLGWRRW